VEIGDHRKENRTSGPGMMSNLEFSAYIHLALREKDGKKAAANGR
jgi:hypothetical protein